MPPRLSTCLFTPLPRSIRSRAWWRPWKNFGVPKMRNLIHRPRRLRRTDTIRRMVRENHVTADDLLYPMFVTMESESREIPTMPGVFRYTVDDLCRIVEKLPELGLPALMLF